MTDEAMSPLRRRMIEDMTLRAVPIATAVVGNGQSGHRAYIAECPILTQLGHEMVLFVAMHAPREVTPAIVSARAWPWGMPCLPT
jgi:hypothetical protein